MWLSSCPSSTTSGFEAELSKRFSTFGTKSNVKRAPSDLPRQSSKDCSRATEKGRR